MTKREVFNINTELPFRDRYPKSNNSNSTYWKCFTLMILP